MPSKSELRAKWDGVPDTTVVLHMFRRSKIKPNGSPFCLKLETYLRAAGIDYEEDFEMPLSADKAKSPWITFEKKDISDSQMCIDHLAEKLDKDMVRVCACVSVCDLACCKVRSKLYPSLRKM